MQSNGLPWGKEIPKIDRESALGLNREIPAPCEAVEQATCRPG
jgi:hypothetical protein